MAVTATPGGRLAESGPMAKPGYKGKQRLDPYVRQIARALMREHGFSESHAIAVAKNATRKWAAGGKGHVRPQVRAGAAASVGNQARIDATHSNEQGGDVELGWNEALHPRLRGRFTSKGRGGVKPGKDTTRNKRKIDKAMIEQKKRQARYAKVLAAQQEQARRIIASQRLGTGRSAATSHLRPRSGKVDSSFPQGSATRALMHGSGLSWSETERAVLDVVLAEAARRGLDIDLSWSEALHPRDPFGKFAKKGGGKKIVEGAKLEQRYRKHVKKTDAALIKLSPTHSTHVTHAHDNGDGTFDWNKDPERAAMHDKIVNNVYRRMSKNAKSERQALFLGGLPGAGKSTALGKLPGVNQNDYVTVNPDIFKEELAKHGLVPNIPGMSPMEASGLVHEESSHLANRLADKARRNGKNIAYDITMNSPGSVHKRLDPLEADGYTSKAVFVDIPHAMSQKRVELRHRNGWKHYIADETGKNLGQRLVPSAHVHTGVSKRGTSSANFDAFSDIKHRFSATRLYDNSGEAPRLVESRGKF